MTEQETKLTGLKNLLAKTEHVYGRLQAAIEQELKAGRLLPTEEVNRVAELEDKISEIHAKIEAEIKRTQR